MKSDRRGEASGDHCKMSRNPENRNAARTFSGKLLPWVFAGVAIAVVAVRLVPAAYLAIICSDNVQFPLLYHDVVEQGHNPHDWRWGGHSDLFPDVLLSFFFNRLAGDGLAAVEGASAVMFLLLIAVALFLYRQQGGRRLACFTAVTTLFVAWMLDDFGIRHGLWFVNTFTLGTHTSAQVLAMAAFGLMLDSALNGRRPGFWVLAIICFLSSASDLSFVVLFTVPALFTLGILRGVKAGSVRGFLPLLCNIVVASAAGGLLGAGIFPAEIVAGLYTHIDPKLIRESLAQLYHDALPSNGGCFIVLLGLDALLMLLVLRQLIKFARNQTKGRVQLPLFALLLFSGLLILCNWSAAIGTGNYLDIGASRYVRISNLLPLFLALGCLHASVRWSDAGAFVVCLLCSAAASLAAFYPAPQPDQYYREAQHLVPILRSLMKTEKIDGGLADYWYANYLTFSSRDTVRMRSVNPDGTLYHWINNFTWFSGDGKTQPKPVFGLILMDHLDAARLRARYGEPDRIFRTSRRHVVWIYRGEKRIAYRDAIGELANIHCGADPNEYKIEAVALPSNTGRADGGGVVAEAGKNQPNYLIYGPYLRLPPGDYRVKISYEYLSAPEPGKGLLCDYVIWSSSKPNLIDHAEIPFADTNRHEFTREIHVSSKRNDTFETRAFYRGSGTVRIESLAITSLKQSR